MMAQLHPAPGATLLDVGCGTGYFSRRFATAGLRVTGLDPDREAIAFARAQGNSIEYLEGTALELPFADARFAYCAAVTSLCFIVEPEAALAELWRVSRKAVILGLLNRHSLLYLQKRERGAYRGARWDTAQDARSWISRLLPKPTSIEVGSAILIPGGHAIARLIETLRSTHLPGGAFLSICIRK
jgi:ubiquinone/menaquinone biosynthesis C-methylase UbiE